MIWIPCNYYKVPKGNGVMPEDEKQTDNTPNNDTPPAGGDMSVEDYKRLLAEKESYIAELKNESGKNRIKAKEAAEEREALKLAQMKRLEQEGNYKAIAEERAKKLAELETYQERATALETTIREANNARIEALPEHMRGLVPAEYAPEKLAQWLDANQSVLVRPQAPNLGAGVAGGNGQAYQLTALDKQTAKMFGLSEADYAAAKLKTGG